MIPLFAIMFATVAGVWLLSLASQEETPYWLRTTAILALIVVVLCAYWICLKAQEVSAVLQP